MTGVGYATQGELRSQSSHLGGKASTPSVFIDDSEKSLVSAEAVGYTPILFRSLDELRKELSALGVVCSGAS